MLPHISTWQRKGVEDMHCLLDGIEMPSHDFNPTSGSLRLPTANCSRQNIVARACMAAISFTLIKLTFISEPKTLF